MSKNVKVSLIVLLGLIIITAGILGAAALLSRLSIKSSNSYSGLIPPVLNVKKGHVRESAITVKGVAEKNVVSDIGAFSCTISCNAPDIKSGYEEINRLNAILLKKFAELGIKAEWVENDSVDYNRVTERITYKDEKTGQTRIEDKFKCYTFTRSCRVRTNEVKVLEGASVKLYELTKDGIAISVTSVEYFISNPEQYKLELVDAATQSAYKRAQVVAQTCGSKLGKLLTARQGVIQITRPASDDTSDYGTYDTRTINKVMRLVVTLDFALE